MFIVQRLVRCLYFKKGILLLILRHSPSIIIKILQLSQMGHVKGSFITFDQIIVSMVQLHFRQNFSMRGSSYELSLVIAGFLTSKPPITGKG